ncbi:hypothetical protein B0H11DRAFT_2214010 [Mycena galericulata]|nr:hypothetical protein B0H11DRAFT_2214010 [Mycena galericulata]
MDLRMLYDYSATCKAIHLNVNRHIGRFMKKTFARIGLSWPNLRFMLAHTDSLLSGYQIHRLLFPGFTARGNTDVDVLDMFVHDFAAGAVSRFFEITTGFKIDRVKKKPSYRISSTFTLVHELPHLFPIKIAVHVAEEDEYPQMAAFRQKLTCNFPFMTGYGIVVPYAAFNFGGDTLINHQYVPLNTNADNRKFKPKWFYYRRNVFCCPVPRRLHSMFGESYLIDNVLQEYSQIKLFRVSLASPTTWAVVKKYLKGVTKQHILQQAPITYWVNGGMAYLPVEILQAIVQNLNIRDLHMLARTCKFFRHMVRTAGVFHPRPRPLRGAAARRGGPGAFASGGSKI